jgi:hypothetical protein
MALLFWSVVRMYHQQTLAQNVASPAAKTAARPPPDSTSQLCAQIPRQGAHSISCVGASCPGGRRIRRSGYSTINAKAETIATKPALRDAFKARRCIIPADAFYEWQKLDAERKQP